MANSVDPDQTAPIGAVSYGSTLFASIINSSVMLGNYLQQMISADDIFKCIFFLALKGLTLCMLGNFSCLYCHLLTFYEINFFKIFFQEHYQCVKRFRSRSEPTFCKGYQQMTKVSEERVKKVWVLFGSKMIAYVPYWKCLAHNI